MLKSFFKWLFRIKPKAVPPRERTYPPMFAERPTPGEQSLDVTLAHIQAVKRFQEPLEAIAERERATGKSPVFAMPYRGTSPSELEVRRARARAENQLYKTRTSGSPQTVRDHRFATQYAQPATPQDRTVEDLALMASVMYGRSISRTDDSCEPSRRSDDSPSRCDSPSDSSSSSSDSSSSGD